MNGSVVMDQAITNSKTMLDISKLPGGVYVLKTVSNDKSTVRKFVKY